MSKYIFKRGRIKMTSLAVTFDAGAELEPEGKKGTMHLMEHLICKTFEDLYPKLTAYGINWNAYTSEEQVYVWFEGLSSKLTSEMKLELVSRITGGLNIKEEVFENEKQVVLQEYYDCLFDNSQACDLNVFRRYWNDYTAIGNENDIKAFTYKDMFETYDIYFRTPAKIVEVGPEKTPGLEDFCKDGVKHRHSKPVFHCYDVELVKTDTSLKTPVCMISPKTVTPADYPYVKVGIMMLTDGMESPYYEHLRVKRGLSYYVVGTVLKHVNGGIMYIGACTNTERAPELCEEMCILTDQLYNLMTKERFNEIMESIKISREKENILKYMYVDKHAGLSKLKMPKNLDKIDFEKTRYIMSRYFADIKIIKCDEL